MARALGLGIGIPWIVKVFEAMGFQPGDAYLLETGDVLLLETNDQLLIEA